MRIIFLFIAVTAFFSVGYAQSKLSVSPSSQGAPLRSFASTELGVFLGTSYYTGDLNKGGHFNPSFLHPAMGLILRRNLSNRWSLKFNLNYGKVSGDDSKSKYLLQQQRNLNFFSPLIESSAQFEFNFFPYSVTDENPYATPYVFAGLGAFWFKPKATYGGEVYELQPLQTEGKDYSSFQPSIPFGIGAKFKFSRNFLLSAEWGLRKTYTDHLDDVSTVYTDLSGIDDASAYIVDPSLKPSGPGNSNSGFQRGNSKTKDWYSFAGVMVTIIISEKPNNCNTFGK